MNTCVPVCTEYLRLADTTNRPVYNSMLSVLECTGVYVHGIFSRRYLRGGSWDEPLIKGIVIGVQDLKGSQVYSVNSI